MKERWGYVLGAFALVLLLIGAASAYLRQIPVLPAAAAPIATPVASPSTPAPAAVYGAVTVYAGGVSLVTLEDEAQAQALIDWRLQEGSLAIPENEALYRAEFAAEIELISAMPGEEPVTLEAAKQLLSGDLMLLPVRCVTRTAYVERVPFETRETEDKRLMKGTRVVLQYGREGERVTVSEGVYLNGNVECCLAVQDEVTLSEPVAQEVLVGSFTVKHPEEPAAKDQGPKGPEAPKGFALALPKKGEVLFHFGIGERIIRNGIEIAAKAGDAVAVPADGVVTFAGEWGGYGFVLEIDHGEGFVTRIAPLKQCALKVGDAVKKGDPAGIVADPVDEEQEERVTLELLIDGIPYNPRQYLA